MFCLMFRSAWNRIRCKLDLNRAPVEPIREESTLVEPSVELPLEPTPISAAEWFRIHIQNLQLLRFLPANERSQ